MNTKDNKKERDYANVRNVRIKQLLDPLTPYKFLKKEIAERQIMLFRDIFIASKENDPDNLDELLLWIRGYSITPEEREKGCVGNFAKIYITQTENKKFYTLAIEKIIREPRFHPQRKTIAKRHPNFGHPIIREIKNGGRVFETFEVAANELARLYEAFPEVTIQAKQGLLYTMIWEKTEDGSNPVKKYILEVLPTGNDKYFIELRPNLVAGKMIRNKFNLFSFTTFDI